ncbi:hypothetical protein PC113_g17948 [Phytophthora cactorum]|uniref:Uncharacterized protein n=1 Tax=Phytophthora cactorum TaxID=29920 RepID=A0A8T0YKV0_9STRA|nr:hypothetical protein PC113_g17948 [Phytophthora cactorum]
MSSEASTEELITDANMISESPTEALAAFEPFVQWLLSASEDDLASLPEEVFSSFEAANEVGGGIEDGANAKSSDSTQQEDRPSFGNAIKARLALAEAEGELETAWDQLSCARREWGMLDDKLLALQDESDENREYIALLERRIIKLLQDRDLAIAETYTTEKQIQDAEFFKAKQQQRRQQQEEEQRKARVASALRKLLLRRSSDESGNSSGNESPTAASSPKYTEKDVQRLQKELADSKVAAAVAKAERDDRRHAIRRAERRFNWRIIGPRRLTYLIKMEEPKPVQFDEESDEEEQNPGAFMWIEGDSLAPPCQSDRDVVSKIVEIARVTPADVRPE